MAKHGFADVVSFLIMIVVLVGGSIEAIRFVLFDTNDLRNEIVRYVFMGACVMWAIAYGLLQGNTQFKKWFGSLMFTAAVIMTWKEITDIAQAPPGSEPLNQRLLLLLGAIAFMSKGAKDFWGTIMQEESKNERDHPSI